MPGIKNVCCVGAGYVGGPTCVILAKHNPDVTVNVVDINAKRIAAWNSEKLPIFEPNLFENVEFCRRQGNLHFSTDVDRCIHEAELIFISVNTPTKEHGEGKGYAADLKWVEAVARNVAKVAVNSKIVVEKSTVPVKSAESIAAILHANSRGNSNVKFQILSNPEFLAEGTAIRDLSNPDRVLIGGEESEEGKAAIEKLAGLYQSWIPRERILTCNVWSSELSKLAANAFLAQRVSSINAMAAVCEETGGNINEVARAVGTDSRIGSKFLQASIGFGGSCFQKDVLNLVYIARSLQLIEVADYWEQVIIMNAYQRSRVVRKIMKAMFHSVTNKKIAVLGFAFKKDTGDTRESSSIYLTQQLMGEGANVAIYDPLVSAEQVKIDMDIVSTGDEPGKYEVYATLLEAVTDASAFIISTEWDEFKPTTTDYAAVYAAMRKPAIAYDGRNLCNHQQLSDLGFIVMAVGSPTQNKIGW